MRGDEGVTFAGRTRERFGQDTLCLPPRLRIHYLASKVYLVLGGHGNVKVLVNGKPERTVPVDGDRLYTLVDDAKDREAQLELRFTPGISAYAFTFG